MKLKIHVTEHFFVFLNMKMRRHCVTFTYMNYTAAHSKQKPQVLYPSVKQE